MKKIFEITLPNDMNTSDFELIQAAIEVFFGSAKGTIKVEEINMYTNCCKNCQDFDIDTGWCDCLQTYEIHDTQSSDEFCCNKFKLRDESPF